MKNRFIKMMLSLVMVLAMAVPMQAFAAEKNCDNALNLLNNDYSNIYSQYAQQFSKAVITGLEVAKAAPIETSKATTPVVSKTPEKQPAPVAASAPTQSNLGDYEQQVVDLVNKERAAVGLPALKVNTKLAGVAEKKAEDLRDNNYFAHQSPTYGSPFDMMKQFGITYSSAGENIAKGQKSPADVMNGWMNSQGHKDNILNSSYTEIGVGYVTDSSGTTYWVQHFIRP